MALEHIPALSNEHFTMSWTRRKIRSPQRLKTPPAPERPARCHCDRVHNYSPAEEKAFGVALGKHKWVAIKYAGATSDQRLELHRFFKMHCWPFAWHCGICLLTQEWTAQHMEWQESDKVLLRGLREQVGLEWAVIAGWSMYGALAEECEDVYEKFAASTSG